jgi:hypothetical protein
MGLSTDLASYTEGKREKSAPYVCSEFGFWLPLSEDGDLKINCPPEKTDGQRLTEETKGGRR